jgi:GNAT superfamily N-acetyltransferase|tara:strand:- start:18 stop:467 length:450 start_codon:yes stop_codon:yes gene_type:complete
MIKSVRFKDLEEDPDFQGLTDEYAAEGQIDGLPLAVFQKSMYKDMDDTDTFNILAGYSGGRLVGFLSIVVVVMPHNGFMMALTESYFVGAEFRKTGMGLKLLKAGEKKAAEIGARGLMVNGPKGGRLLEVLPRIGYVENSATYLKILED